MPGSKQEMDTIAGSKRKMAYKQERDRDSFRRGPQSQQRRERRRDERDIDIVLSPCVTLQPTTSNNASVNLTTNNPRLLLCSVLPTEWAPTQSSLATSSDCQSRRSELDAARCPRRVSSQRLPLSPLPQRQRLSVERTTVEAGLSPLSRLPSTTTTHRRPSARCVLVPSPNESEARLVACSLSPEWKSLTSLSICNRSPARQTPPPSYAPPLPQAPS